MQKQKQDEKLVLVNPVTQDATCISPSISPNKQKNNIEESLSINNILSNTKVINDIKYNRENKDPSSFISNIKLMEDIKKSIEKKSFVEKNLTKEIAPPIPLHSNNIKNNDNNHSVLTQKPKLAVKPTISAAKITSETSAPINFDSNKALSVKKLAEKFNN